MTIKYNANLVVLDSVIHDGGNNDCAYGVAVDSDDNIFVTGYSSNTISGNDYFTIKYDNSLDVILSSTTYDGGNNDCAYGIVVDGENNVIVVGYSSNTVTGSDYFTIKYNNTLNVVLSSATYNGSNNDSACSVAVDNGNNIIVTGISNNDYFTIK